MAMETRKRLLYVVACVSVPLLVIGGLTGCGKKADEPEDPNAAAVMPVSGTENASVDPMETAASLFREPTVNLQNIIKGAKTWSASFEDWWGKIAPDFTLSDVDGNVHTLRDYRGKNVVVVVWASWVATCKLYTPQLKELRDAYPEGDLVILAISNEPPALLKDFAAEHGINYTVLSGGANLAAPFSEVQYAPATFFVDTRGRFKLISTGPVPAGDAKAIIQAK